MYPARLDDKGRLKIPTVFQQYFNSFAEKKLFVTSLDGRTGQIYPISIWRSNENLFRSFKDNPGAMRDVLFMANDFGAETEVDGQGRLTVHPELRRGLGFEGQELHLQCVNGRVDIYTDDIYQERRKAAQARIAESINVLEMAGML